MILSALQKKGISQPTNVQLKNFLQNQRSKLQPPVISIGELEALCIKYQEIPQNLNQPYVVHHKNQCEGDLWFGFLISTPKLISFMQQSSALHCDATYKLSWHGYPVLVVGISDKDKQFHPIAMAVTSGETSNDYEFVFEGIKKHADQNYSPNILIADSAEAITNAFTTVFNPINFLRIYCWFHVTQNIDKKQSLVSKEIWTTLRSDISFLQIASSPSVFNAAKKLWSKKYENLVPNFHQYFWKEYIENRSNWYEGYAIGFPSTNNGLESTNNVIKSQGTFRERLSMAGLFSFMLNQTENWSLERDATSQNCKLFSHIPTINLQIETKAYNWYKSKPDVQFRTSQEYITYFVAASGTPRLKPDDITKYLRLLENKSWKTFDTYKSNMTRLWKIQFYKTDWIKSTCTCSCFLKDFMCKHIVGLAITNKLHQVRPEAKTVPLGEKRKPGRPSKAKKALLTI